MSLNVSTTKKTGKRSWKPAALLDVQGRDPSLRYRWAWKDSANLDKKKAEGWTYATKGQYNKPDAASALGLKDPIDEDVVLSNNNSLSTLKEYRESVLMVMPEELAIERFGYYQKQTNNQAVKPRDLKRKTRTLMSEQGVDARTLYDTSDVIE